MAEYTLTDDDVRFAAGKEVSEDDFNLWLAEVRREAAEKAWDEGYRRGYRDRSQEKSFNPHQEES